MIYRISVAQKGGFDDCVVVGGGAQYARFCVFAWLVGVLLEGYMVTTYRSRDTWVIENPMLDFITTVSIERIEYVN